MTTDHATLREARAAGIDAAIEAIEAQVTDTEATMAEHSAALKNYRATVAAIVPGILEALRKLAAETRKAEPVKPNPFEGWTIQPWNGAELTAVDADGNDKLVGQIYMGWAAWRPLEAHEIAEGPETGNEGRALAEKALVEAGANIPWHEAAGRG